MYGGQTPSPRTGVIIFLKFFWTLKKLRIISQIRTLTDTGENVQKWTRVFSTRRWVRLVARTRRKKRKILATTFGRFRLWTRNLNKRVSCFCDEKIKRYIRKQVYSSRKKLEFSAIKCGNTRHFEKKIKVPKICQKLPRHLSSEGTQPLGLNHSESMSNHFKCHFGNGGGDVCPPMHRLVKRCHL